MDGATLHIPTLEVGRLRLRAPRLSDFAAYAEFRGSERSRIVGGPSGLHDSFTQFCALAGHWLIRGFGRWLVADRETDAPLGIVGPYHPEGWPEPEIAWTLFNGAEGRGVATEAAKAALVYAYGTLGWTTAVSLVAPDNPRSAALARRLGARVEGQFQHPVFGPLDVWRHQPPGAA